MTATLSPHWWPLYSLGFGTWLFFRLALSSVHFAPTLSRERERSKATSSFSPELILIPWNFNSPFGKPLHLNTLSIVLNTTRLTINIYYMFIYTYIYPVIYLYSDKAHTNSTVSSTETQIFSAFDFQLIINWPYPARVPSPAGKL